MKSILLFFALFLSSLSYAQNWAPAGAKWHYTYIGFSSGYVEIANVGDTIIAGQTCQKLQKTFNGLQFGVTPTTYIFDTSYTYENNGVVYVLEQNQWKTLYNFNAAVGEHWPMAPLPEFSGCTVNSQLKVLATGTKVINAQTLKYLVVDFCNPDLTSQGFQDTIIEKIGFTGSYMLPFDMCTMAFDGNEGGPFRCYSDDNFSTYKPFYANDCEFLVGLDENQMIELAIYPNPSAGKFTIEAPLVSGQVIALYNLNGQQVFKEDILNSVLNQTLEINLAPGMYVLKLMSQEGAQLASRRLVVN
jgi:outer membrane protein assembly factor BamB